MANKTPDFVDSDSPAPSQGNSLFDTITSKVTNAVNTVYDAAGQAVEFGKTKLKELEDVAKKTEAAQKAQAEQNAKTQQSQTPEGINPDTPFEALNSLDGWNTNVLSGIHQATYHARLFMTDDSPFNYSNITDYASLAKEINTRKQTTIVETGTTGLSIVSLNIETIASPNPKTRSMSATKIEMVVKEPMGVNFMDMIANSARELRIRNFAKTSYFLEVRFQGYNEDGTFALNPCADFPNKGSWLYFLKILDVQTNFTEEGSTYHMTMMPFEEATLNGDDYTLPFSMMPQANTVGAMLTALSDSLNKAYTDMYKDPTYRTYEFRVQKFIYDGQEIDPAGFKIISANEQDVNTQRHLSLDGAGNATGTFGRGLKIQDIVEMLMANSEAAQKLGKAVMTQSNLTDGKKEIKSTVVFRVVPTVEINDYDHVTESYKLKYVFTVIPYFTQEPIISAAQVEISKDPKAQAKNVLTMRKAGYLAKRYDYLFTGLNTEVTNLDITFNTTWAALLPRVAGFGNSIESNTTHAMYLNRESITKDQRELADLVSKLNEISNRTTRVRQLEEEATKITNEAARQELQAQIDKQRQELDKYKEFVGMDADDIQNRIDALNRSLGNSIQDYNRIAQSRIGSVAPNRTAIKYAEEIKEENKALMQQAPMPVTIQQSNEDTRFLMSGVFPDYYHRDRSIYGAVMDQLYSTQGGSLQSLSMEIIGDPYWLGSGSLERSFANYYQASPKANFVLDNLNNNEPSRANMDGGDILFLLKFKYPQGYDDSTNNPVFNENDTFTGVYKVTKINHHFEGGMFRQRIDAQRMPLYQIFQAFGWKPEQVDKNKNKGT